MQSSLEASVAAAATAWGDYLLTIADACRAVDSQVAVRFSLESLRRQVIARLDGEPGRRAWWLYEAMPHEHRDYLVGQIRGWHISGWLGCDANWRWLAAVARNQARGDHALAEDLVQNVLHSVCGGALRDAEHRWWWMTSREKRKYLARAIANAHRQRGRGHDPLLQAAEIDAADRAAEDAVLRDLIDREHLDALAQFADTLEGDAGTVWMLLFKTDPPVSYREVCTKIGLSAGSVARVKSLRDELVARAMRYLKTGPGRHE